VPPTLARSTGLTHLKLSLRTREPRQARFLAAQMDAAAEDLFMSLDPRAITREQLTELFRKVFETHSRKLALLADFGRQDPTIDPVLESADELAMGWAYRILARKGQGARIGPDETALMRNAGMTEPAIESVALALTSLQRDGPASSKVRSGAALPGIPVHARSSENVLMVLWVTGLLEAMPASCHTTGSPGPSPIKYQLSPVGLL